jgi:fusion protein PurCD
MNAINALSPEYVVKADGLMGGKGVIVHGEHFTSDDEAFSFATEALEKFGQVVLEEKLVGVEFSLMSFVSGETVVDMPAIQDHKRAYEGDTGPNTGGMGTYSDADLSLPFLKPEHLEVAHEINVKTVQALKEATGETYMGILYGGFMLTEAGVKLIEYNARFGDPEAMNALSLLETPLADVIIAALDGTLDELDVTFEHKATVLKYIVPEGYPVSPVKGKEITIDENNILKNVEVYYAAVTKENGKILLSSSRAIALLGKGETLDEAEQIAELAVSCVHGPVFYRKDIGTMPLIQKRIDLVRSWD